ILTGAADRIREWLREQLRRHLIADLLENGELLVLREAGARKLSAVEIARNALVLAKENLLVHLLEVECVIEGKPQPGVPELVSPNVEGESLHDSETALRKLLQHDPFVPDRGEVVRGGPVLGDVLRPPIDLIRFERLQRDRGVAKILKAQLVEIIAPDVDVETLGPIILHPLVDDAASGHELLYPVCAVGDGRLERGRPDIAFFAALISAFPIVLGHDVELADDLRQLAVSRSAQ